MPVLGMDAPRASDWWAQYPEIRFAIIPSKNEDGVSNCKAPLIESLLWKLRAKMVLYPANDYTALIEGSAPTISMEKTLKLVAV